MQGWPVDIENLPSRDEHDLAIAGVVGSSSRARGYREFNWKVPHIWALVAAIIATWPVAPSMHAYVVESFGSTVRRPYGMADN